MMENSRTDSIVTKMPYFGRIEVTTVSSIPSPFFQSEKSKGKADLGLSLQVHILLGFQ